MSEEYLVGSIVKSYQILKEENVTMNEEKETYLACLNTRTLTGMLQEFFISSLVNDDLMQTDLKFVASVAAGGRVKFFSICVNFSENNAFPC